MKVRFAGQEQVAIAVNIWGTAIASSHPVRG